jgi:hypothetical protein
MLFLLHGKRRAEDDTCVYMRVQTLEYLAGEMSDAIFTCVRQDGNCGRIDGTTIAVKVPLVRYWMILEECNILRICTCPRRQKAVKEL